MIYTKSDHLVFARLEKGEFIVEVLTSLCVELGIQSGWVQGIGAVDRIELGAWDTMRRVYHRQIWEQAFEVSPITGNVMIKEGKPFLHLHATVAGHDFQARAGHLFEARVNPTLEVFIGTFDHPLQRKFDEESGLFLAWPL
ncbi:MAG: PPC domain-containing DNA-binding protein [Bacteroidales bacterium]